MRLTRRSRLAAALLALISMLFMQLAVAAYACPSLQSAYMDESPVMAMESGHEDMTGCEGIADTEQPVLCHAHSQVGNQSLDKPAPPDISPPAVTVLVPVIQDIDAAYLPLSTHAEATWLMRASSPPLSIQNCCFRI